LPRPDLEDRNFHFETKALGGPEAHWPRSVSNTDKTLSFKPDSDRELFLSCSKGHYKPSPEWKYNLYQPNEADRGLEPYTDLYSPGYFDFELAGGNTAEFTGQILTDCEPEKVAHEHSFDQEAAFCPASPAIDELMLSSMNAYIVKRDEFKTVIAGYPWFLDWGRDTLICARGLIAAGKYEDVKKILVQFGKFAKDGILPNIIHGEHVGNWDTSDAPLWFFVACSDMCKAEGDHRFLDTKVDSDKTLREVLKEIAAGYIAGTPNGIKMDENSGLIFSPAHFTWMDTNYPAGTPREGYPIEIQALWHAALTFLASANGEPQWQALADQVNASIVEYFMLPEQGYLSDCLHCQPDTPASKAVADDHLRPNQLFALTLGAVKNKALGQSILDAVSALLIPGAIRTLADCPVEYELPVMNGKQLLNDPHHPYWGHYAGNEDSRRKPAYHNGTAWTWPFPSYCEAYYQVYGQSAGKTAKAILSSTQVLLNEGCVGHLPEIVDGNLPHCQKGCDAQAWGATELYRVWKILDKF
jgi:predicted glycogen debranching enzyme